MNSNPAASPPPVQALITASRILCVEPDPRTALQAVARALCQDLSLQRGDICGYDSDAGVLELLASEPAGRGSAPEGTFHGELLRVARAETPYYLSHVGDRSASGERSATAAVPIASGGRALGVLWVELSSSAGPTVSALLDALFLAAGLAAVPLVALYQQRDRETLESVRWSMCREALYAGTAGKVRLCDASEIAHEWPAMEGALPIASERDIRVIREAVRDACGDSCVDIDRMEDFGLCASEAARNALIHGSGGAACVQVTDGCLRVRIEDRGTGIDPETLPRATLLRGWSSRASMGMGFTLIRETADRVYLHTGPGGTTLILEMALQSEKAPLDGVDPLLWERALAL